MLFVVFSLFSSVFFLFHLFNCGNYIVCTEFFKVVSVCLGLCMCLYDQQPVWKCGIAIILFGVVIVSLDYRSLRNCPT